MRLQYQQNMTELSQEQKVNGTNVSTDAGLVWSSKDDAEPVIGNGLKPTYITRISDTNQFSVTIKGVPE